MQKFAGGAIRCLTVVLAGRCLSGPAMALDESVYFSELPVVASVSRLPQRLADAPTAVTVIDRDMIKASGVRSLNDLFRLVPGFQTYPSTTEPPRVSYHGLNDEDYSPRVQVLIDGRSMYSPLFGNGVNWATMPVALEDIERVEVVRGANGVSYGSNAFLGVINIVTVDPALTRGVSVSTNYGSQNVRDYSLRTGGKLGEAGDFRLTYRQQNDDALANRGNWIDSYSSRLFDFRSDFVLTERDSLQLNLGQVVGVTQVGRTNSYSSVVRQETNPIRDLRQTGNYLQLAWRHVYSPTSDLQVRYAYTEDRSDDAFYLTLPPPFLKTYHIDQSGGRGVRQELEVLHSALLLQSTRLAWGGSWRDDMMRSDYVLPGQGNVHREVGRIFGNLEWRPAGWFTGNAGIAGETDSLAGFHLSPRASANFHVTPENTLRIGYSRAYRTGSITDYRGNYCTTGGRPSGKTPGSTCIVDFPALASLVTYQFRADPDMPSERMDTWEIGYLGDWRAWRSSLDVRLFMEKVSGRLLNIDLDSTSNQVPLTGTAIQDVVTKGIEYQFKWQPFEPTRLVLSQAFAHIDATYLDAALAYPKSTLRTTNGFVEIDELTERSMPRRTTSLMLMQKLPYGLEFSAVSYWQDKMKWSRNTWSEKFHRVDARLGYPFRWGKFGGELAYTVQSLNGGHNEYKSNEKTPAEDRVVDRRQWISLRLDY
jgi:iron complex outermembrane recepter protein